MSIWLDARTVVPEDGQEVIAIDSQKEEVIAAVYYSSTGWWQFNSKDYQDTKLDGVTKWMPCLPVAAQDMRKR